MRPTAVLVIASLFFCYAWAWDNVDYEIFDLVYEIENTEGKGTTFYSWLDLPSTASVSEIAKAYRRKSRDMHPDKNPGVKNMHERFARLGVVSQILRNPQTRERYDFFYRNGVPKWRGTGYYYSRYRPGLGSVLVFLLILTSGVQYMVQKMNRSRDLARVNRVISDARFAAWGPKMKPIAGPRKVKVNPSGKGYSDEDGEYVSGKLLDMVVDGEEVFILESDGTLLLLDNSAATKASISSTWFISLLRHLIDRARRKKVDEDDEAESINQTESSETPESDSAPSQDDHKKLVDKQADNKGKVPATMTGGRRRKNIKKRA